jgi:hypothetical protein
MKNLIPMWRNMKNPYLKYGILIVVLALGVSCGIIQLNTRPPQRLKTWCARAPASKTALSAPSCRNLVSNTRKPPGTLSWTPTTSRSFPMPTGKGCLPETARLPGPYRDHLYRVFRQCDVGHFKGQTPVLGFNTTFCPAEIC